MVSGFSQSDIGLLECVVFRLRGSSFVNTPDSSRLDVVKTPSNTSERPNSQEHARNAPIRTCSISDAVKMIARATEPSITSIRSEAIASDLHSLPVEVLREIILLSTCEEMGIRPVYYLKRVLTLQAVCRYFRDVVHASPEFWTFLSSSTPQLLRIQVERSRLRDLSLDLRPNDLRDERVSAVFRLQAKRWQCLRIILQEDSKLLRDQLSSLTFDKVTKLELSYSHSQRLLPVLNQVSPDIFECLVTRMPNISQLYMIDCIPVNSIQTGLTFLSLVIGEGEYWSGFRLPSFIASQPRLSKLRLLVRAGPQIYGMTEYMKWTTEHSYDGKRALDVSIVLNGSKWTHTLSPIWSAVGLIGIAHLSIDLGGVPNDSPRDGLLCKALHFASNNCVPGVLTLAISFNASQETEWVCTEEHDIGYEHELPSALQVLKVHNCPSAGAEILRALLERLLQRQAALHVPLFTRLEMSGKDPSEATRVPIETLVGENRVY